MFDWEFDWPYILIVGIMLLLVLTLLALLIFAPCVLNHCWLSGYEFCPSCGRQVVAICPVCLERCFGDFCTHCGSPVLHP